MWTRVCGSLELPPSEIAGSGGNSGCNLSRDWLLGCFLKRLYHLTPSATMYEASFPESLLRLVVTCLLSWQPCEWV